MEKIYPDSLYLRKLAAIAGHISNQNFCLGMAREMKGDDTPLTVTDTKINQLVVETISKDYPHVQVIGEEGNYDVEGAEYTVLCDPVDGTIPFCRGIPISTFVISVVKGNIPIEAVIFDPFMERMWWASIGKGAYLNGKRVAVSRHEKLDRANITMIWWNQAPYHLNDVCGKLMDRNAMVGNPFTLAYYGALLASGEQEATIFPGTNGWETAAMQLLAEEAGGVATDMHGNKLTYGQKGEIEGHIISNGLIHDELVQIVASCQ